MRWQFIRLYLGLVLVLMIGAVGVYLFGKHEMEQVRINWLKQRFTVQIEMIRELLTDFSGNEEAREQELHNIIRAIMHRPPFPPHRRQEPASRLKQDGPPRYDREPPRDETTKPGGGPREHDKTPVHDGKPEQNKPPETDRELKQDQPPENDLPPNQDDMQNQIEAEKNDGPPMHDRPPRFDRGPRYDRRIKNDMGPGPERGPGDTPPPKIEKLKDLDLPEEETERLEAGEVIALAGEKDLHFFAKLDSETVLTLQRPLPPNSESESRIIPDYLPILIPLAILIFVGVVLYLLIRPIERRLASLTHVTTEFGEGDLARRAEVGRTGSINDLERSFNAMATRIEQLVTSQKDLLRAVSHDIRTPLSRIFFALDDAENAKAADEKNAHLKRIDKALLDLNEMVNELLSFLRLDESEIKPDKRMVEVASLLDHIPELAADLEPDKNIETDFQVKEIYADSMYLKRAVDNLVTNALRHARKTITISTVASDDVVHLIIDDDGSGIPASEREKVFMPFYRLDKSRTSNMGGSGLGLAIVSRIMHWQQGKVLLSDSPEGGARFTLVLPRKPA